MKYVNADIIFPEELLTNSGSRKVLNLRNDEIRQKFFGGDTIDQLSDRFCLSSDTIKKIVYSKK